jgi:UDP-N-acetylglucosamine--N-acetylmuramyl-(pentapeptide) pyrophosphoryl-undecaprenol N-acetylglucosamine transferase
MYSNDSELLTPVIKPRGRRSARSPYRVYISVNGEGYGHSSRALAVARHFDPDCVLLGSYGYVLERLQRSGYKCIEVGPEVKFFGEDGSFDISNTIIKNSIWPLTINRQTKEELSILKQYGITCVLSDCRAGSIFAASKLGLPAIYMTNQTQFDHFFQRRNYKQLERVSLSRSERLADAPRALHEAIWCGAAEPSVEFAVRQVFKELDAIIVADFPPPNTVCLPVLSHRPHVKKLQHMVGPVTAWRASDVIPYPRPGPGPYVVGTLGGFQYREPLFEAIIESAYRLPHVQFEVFANLPKRNTPPNLRLLDFTENPERYYKAADLVVTQAGHSTSMELLSLGKPSLLVPDYKQIEQESNAGRMVDLGVSTQITYPELSGEALAKRIDHHLQSRTYEANAMRLARLAAELDGAHRAAQIVHDFASRLIAY